MAAVSATPKYGIQWLGTFGPISGVLAIMPPAWVSVPRLNTV